MSVLPDSGKRQTFDTGSVRDSREGKGRFDLMVAGVPTALTRLAQHFENGAKKYDDHNWRKGQDVMRYLDSATRHLTKLMRGERDEDHAAAVMWNVACYIETLDLIERGALPRELDNRPEWMLPPTVVETCEDVLSRIEPFVYGTTPVEAQSCANCKHNEGMFCAVAPCFLYDRWEHR